MPAIANACPLQKVACVEPGKSRIYAAQSIDDQHSQFDHGIWIESPPAAPVIARLARAKGPAPVFLHCAGEPILWCHLCIPAPSVQLPSCYDYKVVTFISISFILYQLPSYLSPSALRTHVIFLLSIFSSFFNVP